MCSCAVLGLPEQERSLRRSMMHSVVLLNTSRQIKQFFFFYKIQITTVILGTKDAIESVRMCCVLP